MYGQLYMDDNTLQPLIAVLEGLLSAAYSRDWTSAGRCPSWGTVVPAEVAAAVQSIGTVVARGGIGGAVVTEERADSSVGALGSHYLLKEQVERLHAAILAAPFWQQDDDMDVVCGLRMADPHDYLAGSLQITFGWSGDYGHGWMTVTLAGCGSHAKSSVEWSFVGQEAWPLVGEFIASQGGEICALQSAQVLAAQRLLPALTGRPEDADGWDSRDPEQIRIAESAIAAALAAIDEELRTDGALGSAWRPGAGWTDITIHS